MCGRALEGLCRDLNANEKMLGQGLQELRDTGKIDNRLYEWGHELSAKRNIAAHPDPTHISPRDAQYVFDFALGVLRGPVVCTGEIRGQHRGQHAVAFSAPVAPAASRNRAGSGRLGDARCT